MNEETCMITRIACTAINKRIMSGRIAKNGIDFIGNPVDVTSDCMKAVIEKIGVGNTSIVTLDGIPKFEITVKEVK